MRTLRVCLNYSLFLILEQESVLLVEDHRSEGLEPVHCPQQSLDIEVLRQLSLALLQVVLVRLRPLLPTAALIEGEADVLDD